MQDSSKSAGGGLFEI